MEAVANLRYLRISPRKVKIVLDLIRGRGHRHRDFAEHPQGRL